MKKLYILLFSKLAGTFVDKISPGVKTFLLGFITFCIGLLEALAGSPIYNFLCEYVSFFCGFTESQFYAGLITFLGFLLQLLNGTRALKKLKQAEQEDELRQVA